MRLGGEVLEEQGVHGALEADMQFADFALCDGNDANAGKAQAFEQRRYILLIPRQPVERLRDNHIEAAVTGRLQQRLVTGPQRAGTTYG